MSLLSIRGALGAPALRRGVLFLLALLALAGIAADPLQAQQTGTVQGVVVSARSGDPISGVYVSASGTNRRVMSGVQGRFLLVDVPVGSRDVIAERIGLEPQRQVVTVAAGAVARLEFRLSEQALLLPDVVVSATREAQRLNQTAASVGVVAEKELRDAKPTHPAGVMGYIPGVWVSVTGGEGHMTSIRQPRTTNPVYLFLEDGVPTRSTGFFNHNGLYEVNVPQAERIEVLKGPSTALYGSDAIGGVINVETRRPSLTPDLESFVEGGAFGWGRVLASGSNSWGNDGIRADVNATRTDGWRQGTAYDRQSGTLRWDRTFAGGATLRTVLTGSRIDQQTAGTSALLHDDYLNNPRTNYTPISYRNVRAVRFSSAFEKQSGASLISITPFARWNDMELLPNWALSFDPTVYSTGHSSAGVLAKYRLDLVPERVRFIAGVDVDYSPGGRTEHKVVSTREDGQYYRSYTEGELIYDYDVVFRGISPYLHAEASPLPRLRLTGGLRYDHIGYNYDSKLEPLETGRWRRPADTEVSCDHLSPKLGATYDFGRMLTAFVAYTNGFRAPAEGQLFRQGQAAGTVGLKPVEANNHEVGIRGELLGRLGYSLSAYRMNVRNDILTFINPDGTRETMNAGRTRHRGVEVGLGAALTSELRANLSYTNARHSYAEWQPNATTDFSGNEMESAPQEILNARLAYSPRFLRDSRLALEWNRIGSYWMDAANTNQYEGHDLVHLHASLPVTRSLSVVGRVLNLTDEHYAETASYTVARGQEFAPGMPRAAYLGVEYRLQR